MRPLFNLKIFLIALFGVITLQSLSQETYKGNNFARFPQHSAIDEIVRIAAQVTPSPRQLAWQQMELTTFLHLSPNTYYDQEWGRGDEDPARFNPAGFDAGQWVKVVKEAGSKCAIITCKHHDGFCLWPSKFTHHTIASSPWKNGKGDIVKEVSDECQRQGIGFGIYLSPWDRHEKTYGSEEYNTFFVKQLTELLTNYGPITEVWFDGACGEGPNGRKQVYDWDAYYKLIRKLQPDAVIAVMGPDVRWVGTESGYGRETEWSVVPVDLTNQDVIAAGSRHEAAREGFIPAGDMTANDLGSREVIKNAQQLIWYPSEVDVSIRPGWFWHESENSRVKTPEKLLDIYYSSVGRNSLLLLNIPPDTRGLIHENDIASLKEWRNALDNTFRVNLAANATITANTSLGITSAGLLFDNNDATHAAIPAQGELIFEFDLGSRNTFDVLLLQENIRVGQRVEKFSFQVQKDGKWETVTQGTTIGYKRLLRFDPVSARIVRLVIEQSRMEPALAEFGLYLQPPGVNANPASAAFTDSVCVVLSSGSADASIYYTTDGTLPGKVSHKYSGPVCVKKTTELNFVAIRPGGERSFYSKASYHKANYGVKLVNAADPQYNGGGPLGLVDGVEGSIDFGDGRWTGLNGKDLDATVDLGKATEIHSISVAFNETTASWIFRPTEVRIEVSDNGSNFTVVQNTLFEIPTKDNSERLVVSTRYHGKVRYVRIVGRHLDAIPGWHAGKGLPAWVFADEITIK